METLGHVSNIYYNSKFHEYAERLTEKFPGNLKVTFVCSKAIQPFVCKFAMHRSFIW